MFLGTGHARCPEFLSATLQDHIIKGYFGAGGFTDYPELLRYLA